MGWINTLWVSAAPAPFDPDATVIDGAPFDANTNKAIRSGVKRPRLCVIATPSKLRRK